MQSGPWLIGPNGKEGLTPETSLLGASFDFALRSCSTAADCGMFGAQLESPRAVVEGQVTGLLHTRSSCSSSSSLLSECATPPTHAFGVGPNSHPLGGGMACLAGLWADPQVSHQSSLEAAQVKSLAPPSALNPALLGQMLGHHPKLPNALATHLPLRVQLKLEQQHAAWQHAQQEEAWQHVQEGVAWAAECQGVQHQQSTRQQAQQGVQQGADSWTLVMQAQRAPQHAQHVPQHAQHGFSPSSACTPAPAKAFSGPEQWAGGVLNLAAQQAEAAGCPAGTAQPSAQHEAESEKMPVGLGARHEEYCTQVITQPLNLCALRLLGKLQALQIGEAHESAALGLSLRPRKRFSCSLKEANRALVSKSVKLLLVAPDIQYNAAAGSNPMEMVNRLLAGAYVSGVPVVFALSRRGIGQVFGLHKSVSVIAITDTRSCESEVITLLQLAQQGMLLFQAALNAR